MQSCSALTVKGEPCRAQAIAGTDRCVVHRRVIDEQLVERLLQALRAGNYLDVAAAAVGIDVADLAAVPELREQMETARAEGEARGVATIARAASDNWQAAAWLLERQYPDRWARPAVRQDERAPAPIAKPTDSLDELANRRDTRRALR